MSSVIAPASLLRTIASLQAELSSLQAALGVEGVVIATKGKAKKTKDPNAEPRTPNVWIQFTQRVGALIKEMLTKEAATFANPDAIAKSEEVDEALAERVRNVVLCRQDHAVFTEGAYL